MLTLALVCRMDSAHGDGGAHARADRRRGQHAPADDHVHLAAHHAPPDDPRPDHRTDVGGTHRPDTGAHQGARHVPADPGAAAHALRAGNVHRAVRGVERVHLRPAGRRWLQQHHIRIGGVQLERVRRDVQVPVDVPRSSSRRCFREHVRLVGNYSVHTGRARVRQCVRPRRLQSIRVLSVHHVRCVPPRAAPCVAPCVTPPVTPCVLQTTSEAVRACEAAVPSVCRGCTTARGRRPTSRGVPPRTRAPSSARRTLVTTPSTCRRRRASHRPPHQ